MTPSTFGPQMLVDDPHNFPFPVLYFPTSRHSREFPQSPGCSANCWAKPFKPTKPIACPASKTEETAPVNNRDISGLINQGAYTFEVRSWSNTPPCAADNRQNMVAALTPRAGIEARWAH